MTVGNIANNPNGIKSELKLCLFQYFVFIKIKKPDVTLWLFLQHGGHISVVLCRVRWNEKGNSYLCWLQKCIVLIYFPKISGYLPAY